MIYVYAPEVCLLLIITDKFCLNAGTEGMNESMYKAETCCDQHRIKKSAITTAYESSNHFCGFYKSSSLCCRGSLAVVPNY